VTDLDYPVLQRHSTQEMLAHVSKHFEMT